MKALWKKKPSVIEEITTGVFSKREAADLIGKGIRHIHSSELGKRDPSTKITHQRLSRKTDTLYPWEPKEPLKVHIIKSSEQRHDLISQLTNDPKLKSKRELRERFKIVLEEMITNSLYHAYRKKSGEEKYHRSKPVSLVPLEETLFIRCHIGKEGIYIEVRDHGGSIHFNNLASALTRCYGEAENQIENKESGAGLGLYMIFEAITHLKVECDLDRETIFSCWLSDKRNHNANIFSFNFFRKG